MKNVITKFISLLCLYLTFTGDVAVSQCTWSTVLSDGFEYQTSCPYIIPGTVIHYTPQTFAAHSGTYSIYLNFINCTGTSGTCAGAKVFERGFTVCRNQPVRLSTWLTTTFSGNQCDLRIKISDSNGNVLDDQLSVVAPYAPAWIQYQSAEVTPTSDSLIMTMYTNVGGGNGNDLSMDDFLLEKCSGGNLGNSSITGHVCENTGATDLYSLFSSMNDTTGTWTGPSALGGGYLGTFIPGSNTVGTYVYENPFFGTGAGCPLAYDSVIVALQPAPVVDLGPDTTLCLNQSLLLSAGSAPGNTYLWNNGVTGPNVLAFTNSTVNTVSIYSVLLTDSFGCANTDSITISFEICSGLNDNEPDNLLSLFPNPSNGMVHMSFSGSISGKLTYTLFNSLGAIVKSGSVENVSGITNLQIDSIGFYLLKIESPQMKPLVRKLVVN